MHRKNGQKKQFENENRYPHNPEEGYPPNKSPRHRMEASRHRGGPPHQGPPGPSGPPPKFPFFAPPPPGMEHPRPPHKPPFPFKRDVIKRIQDLFLLIIIEGQGKQGVTAYQLEKQYKYPRTSATRSLESLEGQLILESIEKTEDGRNQKIYLLTDKGKEELDDMKRNWAGRIAMWTEMIPPEKFGHPLKEPIFKGKVIEHLNHAETKEEVKDVITGVRAQLTTLISRNQKRRELLENVKKRISSLIDFVDNVKEFSKKEIIEKIHREF